MELAMKEAEIKKNSGLKTESELRRYPSNRRNDWDGVI
jgi:hypothetical protein